jgi:hypothetical protein
MVPAQMNPVVEASNFGFVALPVGLQSQATSGPLKVADFSADCSVIPGVVAWKQS